MRFHVRESRVLEGEIVYAIWFEMGPKDAYAKVLIGMSTDKQLAELIAMTLMVGIGAASERMDTEDPQEAALVAGIKFRFDGLINAATAMLQGSQLDSMAEAMKTPPGIKLN